MIPQNEYITRLLQLYLQQSNTPNRFSRYDRKLAEHLFNQGVSLDEMKAAFLLASARRAARNPNPFKYQKHLDSQLRCLLTANKHFP